MGRWTVQLKTHWTRNVSSFHFFLSFMYFLMSLLFYSPFESFSPSFLSQLTIFFAFHSFLFISLSMCECGGGGKVSLTLAETLPSSQPDNCWHNYGAFNLSLFHLLYYRCPVLLFHNSLSTPLHLSIFLSSFIHSVYTHLPFKN